MVMKNITRFALPVLLAVNTFLPTAALAADVTEDFSRVTFEDCKTRLVIARDKRFRDLVAVNTIQAGKDTLVADNVVQLWERLHTQYQKFDDMVQNSNTLCSEPLRRSTLQQVNDIFGAKRAEWN